MHLNDRVDRISSLLTFFFNIHSFIFYAFFFSIMVQESGQYQSQVKNEIEIKMCNYSNA